MREIAGRIGCEVVNVYKDHGISGAKGRDKRPAFDAFCRDAAKRQFNVVMAWSVDRLGRSNNTGTVQPSGMSASNESALRCSAVGASLGPTIRRA